MAQSKFLICGLGNPGSRYAFTRHNLGFMVIDELARRFEVRFRKHEFYELARFSLDKGEILLLKPTTFMNRSGIALAEAVAANCISLSNLLVILDDIALPFGIIRLRAKGSSGGHNGLKSIIEYLDSEQFPRLRMGIKPVQDEPVEDMVEFVLSEFSEDERKQLPMFIERAFEAVVSFVRHGIEATMNQFNA